MSINSLFKSKRYRAVLAKWLEDTDNIKTEMITLKGKLDVDALQAAKATLATSVILHSIDVGFSTRVIDNHILFLFNTLFDFKSADDPIQIGMINLSGQGSVIMQLDNIRSRSVVIASRYYHQIDINH
jgi:hypothetical protein